MQTDMQKLAATGKSMMESMKQLGEINFNIMASLSQQQADMVGIYLESGNQQLQAMGKMKDLSSVVSTQTQLAEDLTKKVINNASVTMDIVADAKAQLTNWSEKWLELHTSVWQVPVKA